MASAWLASTRAVGSADQYMIYTGFSLWLFCIKKLSFISLLFYGGLVGSACIGWSVEMKFVFIYFFYLCSESIASAINTWQALSMHWLRGLGQRSRLHGDEVCCQCSYHCIGFLVSLAFFFLGANPGWAGFAETEYLEITVCYWCAISDSTDLSLCSAVRHSTWSERYTGVRAGTIVSDATREQCTAASDDLIAQHAIPTHTVSVGTIRHYLGIVL